MIDQREMEMPLVFLLLNIFLIISAFQVQESAGLNLPYSVPEILPFKDLKFYLRSQMNASSPAPGSQPHHRHPTKSPWKRKWHPVSPKKAESPSPQPMIPPRKHRKAQTPSPFLTLPLPPPPPNQDCSSLICAAPLTLGPSGTPCGCVWPIEVGLHLSTTLYTFFPLVSEFAKELSVGLSLNRSQVRIMGANAANEEMQKTTVILNLVPHDDQFDASTAHSIYTKFWKREVLVRASLFGTYQVLYVKYPGLPPSPPALSASASATISSEPYRGGVDGQGMTIKPLGVEVPRMKKNGLKGTMIMVIVLSSITTSVVCIASIWLLLSKFVIRKHEHSQTEAPRQPPSVPPAVSTRHESHPSIASVSLSSSILPYTGTAKVFSIAEMERATEKFNPSNVIGEGGFGIVYRGILDDGSEVAVKVLKRDDRQGTREFLAEVEMLNRLHHRNLVKLIGLCNDAHCRCLVYELVPNGSVESHLHGADKEAGPLDWCARMKIALGAARGLAYLHEDSSPRVIHRDFKSSNILLEHDFTPKVSDFGLARAAFEEQSKHISTHVMGTFGYLAPEYAMTGHLLVKSDVYSYGVVLLELLTGRKPVDLTQPPGQENLVSWARPLLGSNEGLEAMLDPCLSPTISFDSVSKFAAIASMCVQPEVSHRPFMGEVVQALKLVCNEIEEIRVLTSRTCSQNDFSGRISVDHDNDDDDGEDEVFRASFDGKRTLSTSQFGRVESESFRRQFNSVPLKMERKRRFWERLRGLSRGSMSEHGFSLM